jgi:hypothetical protein
VADCCECGDESLGCAAMELVSYYLLVLNVLSSAKKQATYTLTFIRCASRLI